MQFSLNLATAALLAAQPAIADPAHGLRFNSAGVIDLAEPVRTPHGAAVAIGILAADAAAGIRAAVTITEENPALAFSDDLFGCGTRAPRACAQQHERELIANSGGSVKREGKRLIVSPRSGAPVVFVDWTQPATRTADGDEETHRYLGSVPGNGYARVEVQFGHDAPGSFLINMRTGRIAFVHNTADIAVPAPNGKRLVTYNTLNPPLSIRIAALDESGPRLDLECAVRDDDAKTTALFKGWHGDDAIDFVLQPGADATRAMPLRLVAAGNAWTLAAPDPKALAATGFACR